VKGGKKSVCWEFVGWLCRLLRSSRLIQRESGDGFQRNAIKNGAGPSRRGGLLLHVTLGIHQPGGSGLADRRSGELRNPESVSTDHRPGITRGSAAIAGSR
jgi:hypothetical protein